jgi:hypothetical protein
MGLLALLLGLGWWWAGGRPVRTAVLVFSLLCSALALASFEMLTAVGRLNGWLFALQTLSWQGLGLGFFKGAWPFWELVHSDLLRLTAELGLFGLPLLGLLLVIGWKGTQNETLWSPIGATAGACALEAVLSFPLHGPAGLFLFAVLAGSLAGGRGLVPYQLSGSRRLDEEGSVEWRPGDGLRAG